MEETYYAPQPRSKISDTRESELLGLLLIQPDEVDKLWLKSSNPYLGWRKFDIQYREGRFNLGEAFNKVTAEEAWFLLGLKRRLGNRRQTLIKDASGKPFFWTRTATYERDLRYFDMQLGGNTGSNKLTAGSVKREVFLRQSLVEEAIASSQLEGATMTRERAKKMIAENRKPISHDEWMIYNNYQAMRQIEEETSKYPLSRTVLLELHVLMTKNAIDEEKMGRWRKDSDDIVVHRSEGPIEYIAHEPPKEHQLYPELDRLIAFANDEADESQGLFTHPVVKAVLLHFWFAYLHPFADGNGRLARSLFYWYLMRNNYWLIKYVPISTAIKKSQIQYSDAYIFSEQYNNDLTYFLDYNFRKLRRALESFEQHIERVYDKNKTIDGLLPDKDLNIRQKQLIHHLLGRPEDSITAKQHADFHEVSWITGSQDLKDLKRRDYLDTNKKGREVFYSASDKLKSLLA